MSESDIDSLLRAICGSVLIIGLMICSVVCLYKYAICQEKLNSRTYIGIDVPVINNI